MSFIAPLGSQPICNPSIPYLGPIFGGLRPGMSIYVQGSIPRHMKRFDLNLLCGEMAGSDIALHVNPRFDGWDKVVFKCFQNGCWGHEHKTHYMPFYKGEGFEMVVIVTQEGYQINVNGRELHHFSHRIPVQRVCALQIEGEVFIQTINVIGGGMGGYPAGMGVGMVGGYQGGGMGGCIAGCQGVCVCVGGGGIAGGMAGGYPGGMGGGYPGGMGGYSMGGIGAYPGGMGGYPAGMVGGYQGGGMGGCMGGCQGVCVCVGRGGMGGFM